MSATEVLHPEADVPLGQVYPIVEPALHYTKAAYQYTSQLPILGHFCTLGYNIIDTASTKVAGLEGGCEDIEKQLHMLAPYLDAEVLSPQINKVRPYVEETVTATIEAATTAATQVEEVTRPLVDVLKPYAKTAYEVGEPYVTPALSYVGSYIYSVEEIAVAKLDAAAEEAAGGVDVDHFAECVVAAE